MIFSFLCTLLRTMAGKYYQQHPERSHFADAGLMVALAVIVVTVIKLALYGITVVTLAWLAIALIYMLVAAATKPRAALRTGFTAFFMVVSMVAVVASFLYDYPISPKRESNIKAEQEENIKNDNNRKIKVETPKPVPVETDVVSEDASKFEEVSTSQQPADYDNEIVTNEVAEEDDEDIELIDISSKSDMEDHSNENVNSDVSDVILEEQKIEQFDESFQ